MVAGAGARPLGPRSSPEGGLGQSYPRGSGGSGPSSRNSWAGCRGQGLPVSPPYPCMALQPACPLVEAWGITDRGDCSPAGHPSLVVAGGTAPCTVPAAPSQPDRGHSDPSIPLQPDALCILTPCIRRATLRFMPPTHPTAPPSHALGGQPLGIVMAKRSFILPFNQGPLGAEHESQQP